MLHTHRRPQLFQTAGLELAGPSVAMEPAKLEMQQLLDFYMKGPGLAGSSRPGGGGGTFFFFFLMCFFGWLLKKL